MPESIARTLRGEAPLAEESVNHKSGAVSEPHRQGRSGRTAIEDSQRPQADPRPFRGDEQLSVRWVNVVPPQGARDGGEDLH